MSSSNHRTNVYIGLAGESALVVGAEGTPLGQGGLYRRTEGEDGWTSVTDGLPDHPQVRALLVHPKNPATGFAGTQAGVYRSDDQGDHWTPQELVEELKNGAATR